MDSLTMVFIGGMYLVGRMEGIKVFTPRSFMLFNTPQGQQMRMGPLPGSPDFITIKDYGYYCTVRDENITALYVKVTTGIDIPMKPPLVHLVS